MERAFTGKWARPCYLDRMTSRALFSWLALALSPGSAALAADLQLSAASVFRGASGLPAPVVRIGVTDLGFAGGSAGFAVSDRAVEASYGRTLDLSVAGTARARLTAGYAFAGGGRVALAGSGTLGPLALNLGAQLWSAPLAQFDPLVTSSFEGASTRAGGWAVDASARYRLQRDLVLLASGTLGEQPNVAAGVEWRRGELSLRGGGRFGEGVAGATVGATLRREEYTLALDALVGHTLGFTGSLGLPDPLTVPSNLRVYAAYEPWRLYARTLRIGATLEASVGPGELSADLRGGSGSLGVRLGYTLPLGAEGEE